MSASPYTHQLTFPNGKSWPTYQDRRRSSHCEVQAINGRGRRSGYAGGLLYNSSRFPELERLMSQLFARVELLGTPTESVYEKLHATMENLHWYRQINNVALPHATYQAINGADAPNLMSIADELKGIIERTVWTKCLVLVVRSADWAKTAAG